MKRDVIPLIGGVDSVTTPVLVSPGRLLSAQNFEPDIYGGYRRMYGIERYDGRPSPSSAIYYVATITVTGTISVGDTITGVTSGKTAIVIASTSATERIVTKVSGTFTNGENLNVGGVAQGTLTSMEASAASTGELHATYNNLAADIYRADITAPPGSGMIRGVWNYSGDEYCFRDNVGATACIMYKASSSGWQAISFGREIQFTGAVAEIVEGATVTGGTSGATAVVKRSLLRTGTWTASGAGTLVFDTVTGTFQNGEDLKVGGVKKAVAASADTSISLLPGGRFEFVNYNFTGTASTQRMYFVDGVNEISEFDGTRLVPIRTGIGSVKPKYITGHKNHLFVVIGSSVQVSGIGNPYSWTALTGAAELGLGEEGTGLLPQVGSSTTGVLMVSTKTKIYILYGNDTTDFNLVLYGPESGAVPYTLQNIGYAHFMNARGVTQLQTTQAFGAFQMSVLTKAMQPFIDSKQGLQTASCIVRKTNQYRVFFNDGDGLIVYFSQSATGGLDISLMPFNYGSSLYMNQVCSFVDSDGTERMLGAGSDGMVYELDKGTSLDGSPISAHIMMTFNNSKSVRLRKRYRRTILQFRAGNTAHIDVGYDLSYGNLDSSYGNSVSMPQVMSKTINSVGGLWDNFNWDSFTWDASYMQEINANTPGVGESISILVANESEEDEPFTIHTCMTHYFDGRINR